MTAKRSADKYNKAIKPAKKSLKLEAKPTDQDETNVHTCEDEDQIEYEPLPFDDEAKKDPEINRQSRIKQKELKQQRKQAHEHYELISDLKKKWETLRRIKLGSQERQALLKEMMGKVKGLVADIIFKHDASRIVQTFVKYGSVEDRIIIANELKGRFVELSKSVYGKFLIQRLMRYTVKIRSQIISEFYGHVAKLVKHLTAGYVIEQFYFEFATPKQQHELIQELYSPEFQTFKTEKKLQEISKERSIEAIKENLMRAIKPVVEKGILGDLTIIQRAVLDYLSICTPQERDVLLQSIHVVAILHTKHGSRIACQAIAYGTAKDRKRICKEFKGLVMKAAVDEYGHLVIMQILSTVDDTVLIESTILREFDYKQLDNANFRKILFYILVGRSTLHFAPSILDPIVTNGKKCPFKRYQEILSSASKQIYTAVLNDLEMMRNAAMSRFAIEAIVRTDCEKDDAVVKIAQMITAGLDQTSARAIKSIIQYSERWQQKQAKAVVKEGYTEEGATWIKDFIEKKSTQIVDGLFNQLDKKTMQELATSHAYVAVAFCEHPATAKKTVKMMKTMKIAESKAPGSSILFNLLK